MVMPFHICIPVSRNIGNNCIDTIQIIRISLRIHILLLFQELFVSLISQTNCKYNQSDVCIKEAPNCYHENMHFYLAINRYQIGEQLIFGCEHITFQSDDCTQIYILENCNYAGMEDANVCFFTHNHHHLH